MARNLVEKLLLGKAILARRKIVMLNSGENKVKFLFRLESAPVPLPRDTRRYRAPLTV